MHSSKQYVNSQEKSLSGKGFFGGWTEIDDDETFKVCANDIFVFSCDGQQWNTVLSSQPQGSKSFLFLTKAPLLNSHFI